MITKIKEKEQAIALRRKGFTYSEILQVVHVAKSTLALWLQSVQLAKKQKQVITEKRIAARARGWAVRHRNRVDRQQAIYKIAESQIDHLSPRELWFIGIAIYWAEGAKEKEHSPGESFVFSNSDVRMIKVFLAWLSLIGVLPSDIDFSLYIHQTHKHRVPEVVNYWTTQLRLPIDKLSKVYYKRSVPRTNRKNIGETYYGQLRIRVRRSSSLLRRVEGWIRGLDKCIGRSSNGRTVAFEAMNLGSIPSLPAI
jgi:hypothetical protein